MLQAAAASSSMPALRASTSVVTRSPACPSPRLPARLPACPPPPACLPCLPVFGPVQCISKYSSLEEVGGRACIVVCGFPNAHCGSDAISTPPCTSHHTQRTPMPTPRIVGRLLDLGVAARPAHLQPPHLLLLAAPPCCCPRFFLLLLQVIARANDNPYGLAAGVFSRDINTINTLTRGIRSGTVWVSAWRRHAHGTAAAHPQLPARPCLLACVPACCCCSRNRCYAHVTAAAPAAAAHASAAIHTKVNCYNLYDSAGGACGGAASFQLLLQPWLAARAAPAVLAAHAAPAVA